MKWLHGLIKIIHLIIIVGVIASVFINSCLLKELALTLLIFLLIQYLCGFKKCGLTQLEYYIMGEKYQQGFIYRLVNPIIDMPEKYIYNIKFVVHIALICILTFQLYHKNCI